MSTATCPSSSPLAFPRRAPSPPMSPTSSRLSEPRARSNSKTMAARRTSRSCAARTIGSRGLFSAPSRRAGRNDWPRNTSPRQHDTTTAAYATATIRPRRYYDRGIRHRDNTTAAYATATIRPRGYYDRRGIRHRGDATA
eukprot:3699319-Prymnesium_polylepis.2